MLVVLVMPQSKPGTPTHLMDANRTVQIDPAGSEERQRLPAKHQHLLICIEGLDVGMPIQLSPGETVVGRANTSGLVLAHPQISRQHARLVWMGDHYVVEDLGSGNGTFVGGIRVAAQHRLYPGDVIQFGTTFAFRYSVTDETEVSLMKQLFQTSVLDALTGAHNREYFNKVIVTEIEQSRTTGAGLALLLLDLDHFKRINDTYGHPAGDAVLIEIVNRVKLRLRSSDVLCRYGGEEFALIARATNLESAAKLAERIRNAVSKQRFVCGRNALSVTVSIGCASSACVASGLTADALIAVADRRLYAAKNAGRDRVVAAD